MSSAGRSGLDFFRLARAGGYYFGLGLSLRFGFGFSFGLAFRFGRSLRRLPAPAFCRRRRFQQALTLGFREGVRILTLGQAQILLAVGEKEPEAALAQIDTRPVEMPDHARRNRQALGLD